MAMASGSDIDPRVMEVAQGVAKEAAAEGAEAVVLMWSWVRGDAHPESDVDICVVGRGTGCRLQRSGGLLVAISWQSAEEVREEFRTPGHVGGAVPAWRNAMILYDPKGIAREVQREARAWSWKSITQACDAWVAEELTGWAEEAHKLVANLHLGRPWAAGVQRSLLAIYIAPILGVHHRILYDTESRLWDLVGERMGERWRRAQAAALGSGGETFQQTCAAALELYALAASKSEHLLNARQRAVVAHACALSGHQLPEDPGSGP